MWLAGDSVVQDNAGRWYAESRFIRQQKLKKNTFHNAHPRLEEGLQRYRRDLGEVVRTCGARGLRLVVVTQPTLWRDDLPPELERLLCEHTDDGAYTPGALAEMMDAYNRTAIELCREEGVDCVDLAAQLPKDTTVFYDDCHFNVSGCRRVAEVLADFLATKLSRRTPDGGAQ